MARGRVYNRIYNEEDWNQVNQLNKDVMEDYKMELKQNQKSIKTIEQYWNDWKIIMLFIFRKFNNRYILELTKKDFRKFSIWLVDELKVSNARHNRLMSALRSLLTYAEEDDDLDYENNVARKVKGLKKDPVRDIVFVSNDQVMKLKEALIEKQEYQKATILMLVYDSACRKNELYQCKKECFYDDSRNHTNIVVGKRGKKFPMLYFDGTKECAKLYLKQRGNDDLSDMWVTGKDKKETVTVECIYKWFLYMNDLLEEIEGKSIGFNVHSFRHSALENYSTGEHYMCKKLGKEDGFMLDDLKLLAHHESTDVTSSYLRDKSDDRLQEMFGIKLSEE